MRNFNSRDGVFKPIPGIKITPEGIPIQNEGHKNAQSQVLRIQTKDVNLSHNFSEAIFLREDLVQKLCS